MRIMDLVAGDTDDVRQAAALLVAGFRDHSPHPWPDMPSALAEVEESLAPDRLSRVARDEEGTVLGWIGGISQYDGHVWELHPLVVHVGYQGQGIGRALVNDLEKLVRERGGLTITLGTDDDSGQTTLSGVNLFPDVYTHVARIQNLRHHPYEFYQRLGYTIIGVIPDANGIGKPDILMAKSLASRADG
ncbi:aminoglycoside N-acetyltransferase AAC(6')-Ii [Dictyobacter sp. S3.2.2.5]|uniref:Aminoglycoside N-acetyltransferase AAC(6')-Ii n=1 Tax=Dictyobacter halimunensis TaxID=3026934 RepID=A0ABQ6G751_9CHLR|nr:aminoglycoside N-acetyltransferase AAC(6')-Ii [Dictyobacter sp. S3.2.2.5]